MRAIIQRVKNSTVTVDGEIKGSIGKGYNVLLGVMQGDGEAQAELLAAKIAKLRVFEDENGKMNKSVLDIGGGILVISQFTLCADIKKGNRPSFTDSAPPAEADRLYQYFCECLRQNGVSQVETGVFAADMLVDIANDGPVTIIMDTDIWDKKA
ncbi:MAG: D-tyrosyl-tRNA(Tyr) deacylase [Clostridia bacterium]|nr:D-tyrosyl-tRNA(Tyr) deacylase [Clostridia bacterium]